MPFVGSQTETHHIHYFINTGVDDSSGISLMYVEAV